MPHCSFNICISYRFLQVLHRNTASFLYVSCVFMEKLKSSIQKFFQINASFLLCIFLLRIFENFSVAIRYFDIKQPYLFEFLGLVYDLWAVLIYSFALLLLFVPLYSLSKKTAEAFLHLANTSSLMFYFSFIVIFSERTAPFDHEFFTREASESIYTIKTFIFNNPTDLFLLIATVGLYFLVYIKLLRHRSFGKKLLSACFVLMPLATAFLRFAMPQPSWFQLTRSYYLTCNKAMYWATDSYRYFTTHDAFEANGSAAALEKEIDFYQSKQSFRFVGKEYPLMHEDRSTDVLGVFFNLGKTPPNIVILVVESLSNDFSGDRAKPASFTPFLDSLAKKSLYWSNFLSCATGSFAVYPAMMGSVPYGKNGFSLMTVLPDHNSLIKILRNNHYYTTFMTGFDLDYYNMGSFMRQQGTDFVLTSYGPKYKMMGMDSNGWMAGYPDDALYARSFEVLDSVQKTPYLNTYFTLTTHEPYIFDQSKEYEKRFQHQLKNLNLKPAQRNALIRCKAFMRTVMFSDDCIRKFMEDYKKRKEYSNTIFFITGDHHDGMYPSASCIDDYHVPMMIFSPMLKHPVRFEALNTHNNIAPSILALLEHNYHLEHTPSEVPWVADVLDTCRSFRSQLNSPLMLYSREIDDYIYKDYLVDNDGLFKIKPNLVLEPVKNEELRTKILRIRENYKYINSYVCTKNKLCPADKAGKKSKQTLLYTYPSPKDSVNNAKEKLFSIPKRKHQTFISDIVIPKRYKKIAVSVQLESYTDYTSPSNFPELSIDFKSSDPNASKDRFNYCKSLIDMTEAGYQPKKWNHSKAYDIYNTIIPDQKGDLHLAISLYSYDLESKLKMRNFAIAIYGIEQ